MYRRALEQIVMKALAKKPQDRWPSAGDFGTALARFARTRAPDFGKQKLAAWVKSVLEESSGKVRDGRAATAVRRDQIAQDRNSLLFKLNDAQRRQGAKPAPTGGNATAVGKGPSGNSRPPAKPSPAPSPSQTAAPSPTAAPAPPPSAPREPRPIPVKPARPASPPVAAKPPTRADRATSPVELPEARPPSANVSVERPRGGSPISDFDDEHDATIVDSDRRFSERGADESTRPMVLANLKMAAAGARALVDDPALDPPDDAHPSRQDVPTDRTHKPASPSSQFDLGDADSGAHAIEPGAPMAPLDTGSSSGKRPRNDRSRSDSSEEETAIESPHRAAGTSAVTDDTGPVPVPPMSSSWIDPYQYRPLANATPAAADHASYLPAPGDQSWMAGPAKDKAPDPPASSLRPRSRALWIFLGALALGGGAAVLPSLLHSPPPLRGALEVVSLPAGAEVVLDGKTLPTHTPIEMSDLDPANVHHVTVTLAGYEPFQRDIHFDAATPRVRLQAVLVSDLGELELRSTPTGAEVVVNGRVRGVTPLTVGELPRDKDVQVDLRLRGHKEAHRTYQFGEQKRLEASVPLERSR